MKRLIFCLLTLVVSVMASAQATEIQELDFAVNDPHLSPSATFSSLKKEYASSISNALLHNIEVEKAIVNDDGSVTVYHPMAKNFHVKMPIMHHWGYTDAVCDLLDLGRVVGGSYEYQSEEALNPEDLVVLNHTGEQIRPETSTGEKITKLTCRMGSKDGSYRVRVLRSLFQTKAMLKSNAKSYSKNENGTVTIEEPFFRLAGEKLAFEQVGKPQEGTRYIQLDSICRFFGFKTSLSNGHETVEKPGVALVSLTSEGELKYAIKYTEPQSELYQALTSVTCK